MRKQTYILLLILLGLLMTENIYGQLYMEKQTRHRFASMTMGMDVNVGLGGSSSYLGADGSVNAIDFSTGISPRILIGGTHFWGHAEFLIAIPVYTNLQEENNQIINMYNGVETIFKYYPWRIEKNKLRPYIGLSLTPYNFSHDNGFLEFPEGPSRNLTRLPIVSGLSYQSKNVLFELGLTYNYDNKIDYYISQDQTAQVSLRPLSFNLGAKYILDTTIGAERGWESGNTQEKTKQLAAAGELNNFFIGAGLSSAWWLDGFDYNEGSKEFLPIYDTNLMADFTLGYYLHQPDLDLSLNYRGYTTGTSAYGTSQVSRRRSVALEVKKMLFDYQGFVPFIGPIASYENLTFVERIDDVETQRVTDDVLSYGLVFGWDIRPTRKDEFILRTTLRYFPSLNLENVGESSVNFDTLEFNFIQLILFPGRIW